MGQPQAELIYEDTLEQWVALCKGGVSEPEPDRSEEHSFELGCFSVIKSVLFPMAKFVVALDFHHSLIHWRFVIHRCINGYSPATVIVTKEQEKALQNLREYETVKILTSTRRK